MDPITQTIIAFGQAVLENPVASGFIFGLARNISGWLQSKYKEKTGVPYDPVVLGTTILKYEVAVNALVALVPPEHATKVAPLVMISDIIFSAARKLRQ